MAIQSIKGLVGKTVRVVSNYALHPASGLTGVDGVVRYITPAGDYAGISYSNGRFLNHLISDLELVEQVQLSIDDKVMNNAVSAYFELDVIFDSMTLNSFMVGWGLGKSDLSGYSNYYQGVVAGNDVTVNQDSDLFTVPSFDGDALRNVLDQFVHWFQTCPYSRSTNEKRRVLDNAFASIQSEFKLTDCIAKNYFCGVRQRLGIL
jgi:hypothetical protein